MTERRTPGDVAIAIAGFAVAAGLVAPLVLLYLTNQPDQRMVDLDVYRSAGQAVVRGAPVYDLLTQPPQLLPFTYPTFAVLLAVPLAFVPWAAAQWLWVALILLALAVVVRFSFAGALRGAGRWAPLLAGVLVALCAYPMPLRDQIRFGQVDLFLAALCVADCAQPRTRWPRGLLVGLATAIKLLPGVFIVYFWITGRRREAVTAAGTAVAATVGTFLVLPGDSAGYWFGAFFDSERLGANGATANQSMRGMLLRLGLPDTLTTVIWLACAAAVAYVAFRAARRASLGGQEVLGVAITGLIGVLVSPVSWIHHLAWLVLVFGALATSRRGALIAAGCWVFFVCEIPWWGIHLLHAPGVPRFAAKIVQDGFGLGVLALVVVLVRRATGGSRAISSRSDTTCERSTVGTLGP